MAIVKKKSTTVITANDTQPINFDNNIVVDGYANNSISKYVKYIDGKILEVDYYSFVRGSNGENSLIDTRDDTQQYIKVDSLQLTITSPITPTTYDDVSFEAVMVGVSLVPAENDLMILRLIDGRLGMFRVSDIRKQTYVMKEVYNFKGSFLYYSDANVEFFKSLESKVVKNYVYDKSHISENSSPILTKSSYLDKMSMKTAFNGLLESYIREFSYEKVICFNLDGVRVYDYNIDRVIKSVIGADRTSLLKSVVRPFDARNIVDDILDKNISLAMLIERNYSIGKTRHEISEDWTISLLSSDIHNMVYMHNDDGVPAIKVAKEVSKIIPNNFRIERTNIYLFSSSFYTQEVVGLGDDLSLLETLLVKYIDNEVVATSDLRKIIDDIDNWDYVEKFFYTPFLLLLLDYSMLNTHSRI